MRCATSELRDSAADVKLNANVKRTRMKGVAVETNVIKCVVWSIIEYKVLIKLKFLFCKTNNQYIGYVSVYVLPY